jgi:hypothetical protein
MESFLKRHFKPRRIRFSGKWKRVVIGYDNKKYYISDEIQKAKLKTHLVEILAEVFSFDMHLTKKVVNRFI